MDGVELTFEEDALTEIAHEALLRKTGARGLKAIIEGVMEDVMYEIPSMDRAERCIITKSAVQKQEKAQIIEGVTAKKDRRRLKQSEGAQTA